MTEDHDTPLIYGLAMGLLVTASASVMGWIIWLAWSAVFG